MLSLLQEELKKTLKAQDKAAVLAFRNIIGKLKARQIDKGTKLDDKECIQILQSSIKQLKESIRQYTNGGRNDLAESEKFELKLMEKYLPKQLSENEIKLLVQEKIKSTGATSIKDMGSIMGKLMNTFAGSVDGKLVKRIVEQELSL